MCGPDAVVVNSWNSILIIILLVKKILLMVGKVVCCIDRAAWLPGRFKDA